MQLDLREETPRDVASIFEVNAAAFETDTEARLVDALRAGGGLMLSLVARHQGAIIGHAAFSPVTISGDDGVATGAGLAPMAVLPKFQRMGVGAALIAKGLELLRERDIPLCVVLGHADYYPRFGFEQTSRHGIRWEHDVPEDVFFVQALQPNALDGVRGVVRYRPEFDGL